MIKINQINKSFFQNNKKNRVLDNLSFQIVEGQVFGLLGPNGAGKTTALRIISGILEADEGNVTFNGDDISIDPVKYKSALGFLSSGTQLYPLFTGYETLHLFGSFYQKSKAEINVQIKKLDEALDLKEILSKKIATMSTGQKQRINIARTLIHDPKILILDEPTNGLDILSSKNLLELIKVCKTQNKIIIYSTHILSEIELVADTVGVIYQGKILVQNNLENIIKDSGCNNLSNAFLTIIQNHNQGSEVI